jgi:propanol-preferring alcohol dehydrogenase
MHPRWREPANTCCRSEDDVTPAALRAMIVRDPASRARNAPLLEAAERPMPPLGADDVLVRVSVCGVCRTDLDVAEGRVAAPSYPVVPGHQVVGHVAAAGRNVSAPREGDRIGVAWIRSACGECRWCLRGEENLCPYFQANGCDADGGYADYVVVPGRFTYLLPESIGDAETAPLLCAGAIGWRSLRLTELQDGDALGLTGFGASAHLVLQLARHRFPSSPIFVFARSASERDFARRLGADWTGESDESPPSAMGAIIDTTPAWKPVVDALPKLMAGGRLVINAIRKTNADRDELLRIQYDTHLWREREVKSVANVTRADVREMLDAAAAMQLRPTVEMLPLERAHEALERLRSATAIRGATVLQV